MAQKNITDALKQWQLHNDEVQSKTIVDRSETKATQLARIKRARKDYAYFVEYYFPHFAKTKCGEFQIDAANYLLKNQNTKAVFKWARAHAKSTHMDVFIPMWLKCQEVRQINVMVLVGKSNDNANTLLADIQSELQFNQRYINDFGDQFQFGHWTDGEFVTRDGCAFFALGRGQSPRGLRYREQRPDYVVIDDLDDDELIQNEHRVNKLTDWVKEALFGVLDGGRGRFIMVGNLIGQDAVLQRIADTPGVHVSQVNIYDANGDVTWAAKWKKEEVEAMEVFMGYRSFQKEYMNNPITEGTVFGDLTWGKCPPLHTMPFVVNYADPSPSNKDKQKKGVSFKATWIIGYKDGKFYIYHGFLDQVTNLDFADWFYAQRDYVGSKTMLYNYIENNTLQDPFFEQVFKPLFFKLGRERGFINITPDPRRKPEKAIRIEGGLEPLVRNSQLVFNIAEKDNPHMQRLSEQFKLFNMQLKSPSDGPDCIEGGVDIINQKIAQTAAGGVKTFAAATNRKRI
jgi:hypothetical protein